MNGYSSVRFIVGVLSTRKVPLVDAVRELASVSTDPDFVGDVDGMLGAWASVVRREVLADERVMLDDGLSYRQEWIVDYARSHHGRVRACDVLRTWPVSAETVRADFVSLCRLGHLSPIGAKRGRFYVVRAADMPSVGDTVAAS